MRSLRLGIDRIVVDGLPASAQRRFVGALEERLRELARSGFAEAYARNARVGIGSLDAGRLRPGATPDEAALQVVDALRQGLRANGRSQSPGGSGRGGGEAKGRV